MPTKTVPVRTGVGRPAFLQLFSFPVLKIFHFPGGDPA